MNPKVCEKVYSSIPLERFTGRDEELDFIVRHAARKNRADKLLVLAPPASGLSELLRQSFDLLFLSQEETVPFYFSFSCVRNDPLTLADSFLISFLWQAAAFRRHDPRMLCLSPTKNEVKELSSAKDFMWLSSIDFDRESSVESYLRFVFNVPVRFFAAGLRPFIIFDDVQVVANLGESFLNIFQESIEKYRFPYVLAGRRRALLSLFAIKQPFITLRLNPLKTEDAKELIEKLSKEKDVKVNDQTIDLITTQFQASPFFITFLFDEASKMQTDLNNYKQVEVVANEMIFSGSLGRYFDSLFNQILPDKSIQKEIIGLLHETARSENKRLSFKIWEKKLASHNLDAYKILQRLHIDEIIRLTGSEIEVSEENFLLYDYIQAKYRLEVLNEPRALVVGESLLNSLKRAPRVMAKFYRKNNSLDLKSLFSTFNFQEVDFKFFDHGIFRSEVGKEEKITLPQFVYVAEATAFYPSMSYFVDKGFSYVALGFKESGDEVSWLAVQVDSTAEITKSVAEFWCDRLETIALVCGFLDFRIWLIAPSSFTEEALQLLRERGVYSSNFQQVQCLAETLNADEVFAQKIGQDEYELVLPMGEDTELIAAHAVEEVARRAGFSSRSINKIKTALIEACINASEHSRSPDRKIHQKFKVENDRLIITVSNRGIKIPLEKLESKELEGKRGWGLKLIKSLMDDTKLVQTDEGVKIVMTKNRD